MHMCVCFHVLCGLSIDIMIFFFYCTNCIIFPLTLPLKTTLTVNFLHLQAVLLMGTKTFPHQDKDFYWHLYWHPCVYQEHTHTHTISSVVCRLQPYVILHARQLHVITPSYPCLSACFQTKPTGIWNTCYPTSIMNQSP